MSHATLLTSVLAQAPAGQQSILAWMLDALGSFSALLMLASAAVLFAGACYLVATRRSSAVLASYLVLLPLPVLISLAAWLKGSIASLMVIAASPGLELTSADLAGGLATAMMSVLAAMLVTAPTYFVLAFGLLRRTWSGPAPGTPSRPASPARNSPSDLAGAPFVPA